MLLTGKTHTTRKRAVVQLKTVPHGQLAAAPTPEAGPNEILNHGTELVSVPCVTNISVYGMGETQCARPLI